MAKINLYELSEQYTGPPGETTLVLQEAAATSTEKLTWWATLKNERHYGTSRNLLISIQNLIQRGLKFH